MPLELCNTLFIMHKDTLKKQRNNINTIKWSSMYTIFCFFPQNERNLVNHNQYFYRTAEDWIIKCNKITLIVISILDYTVSFIDFWPERVHQDSPCPPCDLLESWRTGWFLWPMKLIPSCLIMYVKPMLKVSFNSVKNNHVKTSPVLQV